MEGRAKTLTISNYAVESGSNALTHLVSGPIRERERAEGSPGGGGGGRRAVIWTCP